MKKIIIIFALSFLIGCGGSDSSPEPTPPERPPQSEGTYTNPINLGTWTDTIIHSGSISANGISFYKFTTSSSGVYFIGLLYAQSRLAWTISLPGQEALLICSPDPDLTTACFTPYLNAYTTYYVAVLEMDNIAGTYTIGIN